MKGEKQSNDFEDSQTFSNYLKQKISDENLLLDNIYDADESGIFWRTIVSCTLSQDPEDVCGRKDKKDRITTLFCANASGRNKIPLLVIGKSQVPRCLQNFISKSRKKYLLKETGKPRCHLQRPAQLLDV